MDKYTPKIPKPRKSSKPKPILVFSQYTDSSYRELFTKRGFSTIILEEGMSDIKARGVVFSGGADVDPRLYGEVAIEGAHVHPDFNADKKDLDLYMFAKERNLPMIGICRGAQFINVVHGGTLQQHITGHAGIAHKVYLWNGNVAEVNSYHHQSIVLPSSGVGISRASTIHPYGKEEEAKFNNSEYNEIEAAYYASTHSIGVQWHPEIKDGTKDSEEVFWELFKFTKIEIPE
jgi:gamma-glutamyl-gamma-aminobutyrate hydrolase PuuD